MPKSKVVIQKMAPGDSIQQTVAKALDALGVADYLKGFSRFLLKPNYIASESPDRGNITCPETIEGIIQYLLDRVGKLPTDVILGEGSYPSTTEKNLTLAGARDLAAKYDIELLNLNKDEIVEVTIPDALSLKKVKLGRTALDVDCVVSIPSLKTHSMATTTLALKNLMGTLSHKSIMHSSLHKKIADLASVIRPKLSVIDGIIGSDGFEEGGNPVRMDMIIVGTDPVAVDTVGSAVIGYTPEECRFLQYAEEKGLGTCNLDEIEVIGKSIHEVYRKF